MDIPPHTLYASLFPIPSKIPSRSGLLYHNNIISPRTNVHPLQQQRNGRCPPQAGGALLCRRDGCFFLLLFFLLSLSLPPSLSLSLFTRHQWALLFLRTKRAEPGDAHNVKSLCAQRLSAVLLSALFFLPWQHLVESVNTRGRFSGSIRGVQRGAAAARIVLVPAKQNNNNKQQKLTVCGISKAARASSLVVPSFPPLFSPFLFLRTQRRTIGRSSAKCGASKRGRTTERPSSSSSSSSSSTSSSSISSSVSSSFLGFW